jgi:hypothetical protein
LFASKFLQMAPLSHNAATNQINAIGVVLTGSVRGRQEGCGGQCDGCLFLPELRAPSPPSGALFIFVASRDRLKRFGPPRAYVEPTKTTVAEFVCNRITQWESAGAITARTAARYRELAENQIAPHLGDKALQKTAARSTSRNGTRHGAKAAERMARAALLPAPLAMPIESCRRH